MAAALNLAYAPSGLTISDIATNASFRRNLIDFMMRAKMANQLISEGKTAASWSPNFETVGGTGGLTYRELNSLWLYCSGNGIGTPTNGICYFSRKAIQYQYQLNQQARQRSLGLNTPLRPSL